jgi:hypothetical protein
MGMPKKQHQNPDLHMLAKRPAALKRKAKADSSRTNRAMPGSFLFAAWAVRFREPASELLRLLRERKEGTVDEVDNSGFVRAGSVGGRNNPRCHRINFYSFRCGQDFELRREGGGGLLARVCGSAENRGPVRHNPGRGKTGETVTQKISPRSVRWRGRH